MKDNLGPLPETQQLAASGIEVYSAQRHQAGSCNACLKGQYALDERNNPLVTEVHIRGLSLRLCARCHAELKALL